MVDRLSFLKVEQDENISLLTNQQDVWVTAIKVISNFVPFGSPVGELITSIIPNQKIDRVIRFTEKLNEKLIDCNSKQGDNSKKITNLELKTAEFGDLYEEAANQASRALTDERLEYIASLLKNSLTDEELEHIEKKKLLSLLGELNDAEIIWLKNYSYSIRSLSSKQYKSFYENHKNVLESIGVTFGSGQEQIDKDALQKSYKENLLKLGLIKESFRRSKKAKFQNLMTKQAK